MFYGELASRLALIREAASRDELAELDERAHELKGSCLSLGLGRMAALCGEMEALARGGSAQGAQALLDQMNARPELSVRCWRPKGRALHARMIRALHMCSEKIASIDPMCFRFFN